MPRIPSSFDDAQTTARKVSTTPAERYEQHRKARVGSFASSSSERRITNATTSGKYNGAELQPFTGRPGALDAYKLPSRMSNRLVYPRLHCPDQIPAEVKPW